MIKNAVSFLIVGVVICSSLAYAQSDTEKEVKHRILESFEYTNTNLKTHPEDLSKHGVLEFWSSGGLLEEIAPGREWKYDAFNIQPKHIKVITLVEGQAAVAHYYMEGSMKPKGSPAVSHYLTRVTAVLVKEDGKWKNRSTHWSPVIGGSGTTQTTQEQ